MKNSQKDAALSAPAIVIRPLRPLRAHQAPPRATEPPPRSPLGPSAAQLARDPRAYPSAPPRLSRAVKRVYAADPEA